MRQPNSIDWPFCSITISFYDNFCPSSSDCVFGSPTQVDEICTLLNGDPQVLARDMATKEAVLEGMQNASWIHMACHGVQVGTIVPGVHSQHVVNVAYPALQASPTVDAHPELLEL